MKRTTVLRSAALLALVMLLTLFPAAVFAAEAKPFDVRVPEGFGDMDGNGKVTAGDARFVLRLSARLEEGTGTQKRNADADSDGRITAKDARIILRVSAKLDSFENTLFLPQFRAWLKKDSKEAALILTEDTYYYNGSVRYENTAFMRIEYARDGDDYYSFVQNGSDIPLAAMLIDGKPYLAEPKTKACIELTRENCDLFGLDYDEIAADDAPADEGYDYRNILIGTERSSNTVIYEIRYKDTEAYDRLWIVDGSLHEHRTVDAADGTVYNVTSFHYISETIPDGLLDLSTYRLAKNADEFLRMLG